VDETGSKSVLNKRKDEKPNVIIQFGNRFAGRGIPA